MVHKTTIEYKSMLDRIELFILVQFDKNQSTEDCPDIMKQ